MEFKVIRKISIVKRRDSVHILSSLQEVSSSSSWKVREKKNCSFGLWGNLFSNWDCKTLPQERDLWRRISFLIYIFLLSLSTLPLNFLYTLFMYIKSYESQIPWEFIIFFFKMVTIFETQKGEQYKRNILKTKRFKRKAKPINLI